MRRIKNLVGVEYRVPTGALRIGSDWPGVFLRGDEAEAWAQSLDRAARELTKLSKRAQPPEDMAFIRVSQRLRELKRILGSARVDGDEHDRIARERGGVVIKRGEPLGS